MSKKIVYLILSSVLILPSLASAITIQEMTDAAVETTLWVASGIVVILWVVTGILFLSALGAPEKLKSAKTSLLAAVAGTILVIVAASAISLVGSAFGI